MMSPPNKEARNNNNRQLNGDDECGNPNLNEMPITATTQVHSDQDDEADQQNNQDNNDNNHNDTNYDQHGQVVYQQLQSDDYQQNQSDNEDSLNDDEDNSNGFDDFQYLAESRANSKRVSTNSQIKPSVIDDDNDIFKQKKLESENIQIDSSKSEIINNIMKNIKISNDCIPDWAKVIPEQLWRKNLIENINVKQTNLFESQKTSEQDEETSSNTI